MRAIAIFFILTGFSISVFAQWQDQNSGTDVQLRGISAVSDKVAWASGANGTVLRTLDRGEHWEKLTIAGADKLDFRDVHAFDERTAYVLSIGPGGQSRIYKTTDGGLHWQLQFTNPEPKAFYDCFAFWDNDHGIALSDSVDGNFPLLSTSDGSTWKPLVPKSMPAALPNEGAFAASGTCIATLGKQDVWFATGGPAARVFHSSNRGQAWTVTATPILSGQPSQGIFSIAFWDTNHGIVVGGDYGKPANAEKTGAYTQDGGATWIPSLQPPSGYRSGLAVVLDAGSNSPPAFIAVGTTGTDISSDGKSWVKKSDGEFNAVSFAGKTGWAVGPHGRIGRADLELETVLTAMDRVAAKFSTAQADFEWDNYQKAVDETDKQTGKVYFRRSGKGGNNVEAMFEVASPAAKQVLIQSGRIQLYNPKIDQITEHQAGKNSADVDAFLNLGFGGRGHDLLKSYDVKMVGWETVDGVKTARLQLTPFSPKVRNMFSQFILWIDPERDVARKQQVLEPSGDDWVAHYTGFILGRRIPDEHFRIKTTPHTKVVTPGGN